MIGKLVIKVMPTVAALHQGASGQMTWLEDPPPWPMTRLEDLLCFDNECEQKIKMSPYLTALFHFDSETISGVGGLCFEGSD